jgi:RLL motif-containing protein 1
MALARTFGAARAEDAAPTDALDACVLLEKCVAANERFVTPFTSVDGAEAARNPPSLDDVPSRVGLPDDATVEKAVSVARLLHVNDLRRLQSDVDAFLVSMQEYTADPKTDSRIGRVGR